MPGGIGTASSVGVAAFSTAVTSLVPLLVLVAAALNVRAAVAGAAGAVIILTVLLTLGTPASLTPKTILQHAQLLDQTS